MPLSKIKIRWGYFVALALMLISYGLIFYIINKLAGEKDKLAQSHAVAHNLEAVKAEITDAETGVRGYIITSDNRFLTPYETGSKNVKPLLAELRDLTRGNSAYDKSLGLLESLISRRLAALSAAITSFQVNKNTVSAEMRASREANKLVMDSIRIVIGQLQNDQKLLVGKRDNEMEGVFGYTQLITAISLLIALVTIIYSVIVYNRENKAKETAIHSAKTYGQQLEDRVTELDKVNSELQELKSIEKFAATGRIARTMAHEVRNPLTNISLASEQLKDIVKENEEADLLLEMISRNVNRINQLVSDLLNSTRFAQLEYTTTDINKLIDDTLEFANDRIELNNIQIIKNYANDLCDVLVDREKIKLAFLNIIVNAIEAMDSRDGILQIRTRKIGTKCQVEFIDNGVGMDDDTVQRLFEPYFTSKLKGNGLGLTNTQNIVLNHKGHITVRSKKGTGSTFVITLNENIQDEAE